MGSINRILAGGNALKAWGLTRSVNGAVRGCSASYLINLVARASTSGGMVTPICFAVFRFIHQLELGGLLYRQICRLGPLQNPVHEICDTPVLLGDVIPVRHETARIDILWLWVN